MTDYVALNIKQVLVAIQSTDRGSEIADIAAQLAELFGVSLRARFVRDPDMINLAAMPFGRRIDMRTGALEAFQPEAMERALTVHADAAHKALAASAAARNLQWSFETVTAPMLEAFAQLCSEPGLIVATLDAEMGAKALKRRLADLLAHVPDESPVLLLQPGRGFRGNVAAAPNNRVMAYAVRFGEAFGRPVIQMGRVERERPAGASGVRALVGPFGYCSLFIASRENAALAAEAAEAWNCHILITEAG